jgi:hypothetical protein
VAVPATPGVKTVAVDVPPELPPKNIKTGVERIAELQRGDLSEISVDEEGQIGDYAQYCINLLKVRA